MKPRNVKEIILEKEHTPSGKRKYDVQLYLTRRQPSWKRTLVRIWRKFKAVKFDVRVTVRLQKREGDEKYIYASPCFRSHSHTILSENEIEERLQTAVATVLDAYDVYMKQGSGWILQRVESSQQNVYQYSTMSGGGGKIMKMRSKLLPTFLVSKTRSLLTFPSTTDNKCFLHCVLAALYPIKGPKRTSPKAYAGYEDTLQIDNLTFPVSLKQIPEFEKRNDLSINVFAADEKTQKHYYLQRSNNLSGRHVIDLLLHNDHFSLIMSWTCFTMDRKNRRIPCRICGRVYKFQGTLDACSYCTSKTLESNLVFPDPSVKHKFCNFKNVCMNPFVYYCDLETIATPVVQEKQTKTGKIERKKEHHPIAIGLLRVSTAKEHSHEKPIILTGEDCIEKFFDTLRTEAKYMDEILETVNHPINMSPEQERDHFNAEKCYVCQTNLDSRTKMRDHNHLIRKENYLGAICNGCNLNRTDLKRSQTPLIFHNSAGFDIQFIIQKLDKINQGVTYVIGKTGERIMSMNLLRNRYIVMDSLNHLQSSLSSLVEILKKSGKPLIHTQRCWQNERIELLSRKGVFPYSFLTNSNVLTSTVNLPPADAFYDELTEKTIDIEDYKHAERVWNHFKCKNLMDYMKLYLKTDITLLADVFENYRHFFEQEFQLDSTRYLSLPGLSYDCMLRYTNCVMDFVHDLETFNFLKLGLRGGVAMIPHRYAFANNPELKDYDPNQPTTHLVYLDCNALYSSIMTKKLPYKKLRWVSDLQGFEQKIDEYTPDDRIGYFIECDLDYPTDIHDLTRDLPLAPEHKVVQPNMLSSYAIHLVEKLGIKLDKLPKLLSTQFDRKKYVCHIENLKFYLQRGMKLVKIHRVLSFKQKAVFEPYIRLCINKRNLPGTSPDEKTMWKLCCNSVFGRTIMNVEKKNSIKLVTNPAVVSRAISNPRFKHADLINDCVVQVTSVPRSAMIKTPYFIGVAILELSKLHMMRLHYEHFMKKYGRQRLQLCMTDTDSFLYHIQTKDLHQDLRDLGIVEFGNYPVEHPFHDKKHAGELFFLKDESAGIPIRSFVGLRAKSYSLEYEKEVLNKVVGKGIPKAKLRNITHNDMLRVLRENITTEVESNQLRSFKHHMYSIKQTKLALSSFDSKRYMCDAISTLPFGHIDTFYK